MSARAGDGTLLKYGVHGGEQGGTALQCMNGLLSSTVHWDFFIPHYARTRPVIAWDYRGHGGAPAPDRSASISVAEFGRDAEAVRAHAVSDRPVILAGLSFGVQVALEHYRTNARRVRALVLICGVDGYPLDRVSSSARLRRFSAAALRRFGQAGVLARAALKTLDQGALFRELAYVTGGAHRELCPPEFLDRIFRHSAQLDPRVAGAIVASFFEHSAADVLSQVRVPTLIIGADKDELAPPERLQAMCRLIPGAELEIFTGHTHLVQVERPQAVHERIDRFLADHDL